MEISERYLLLVEKYLEGDLSDDERRDLTTQLEDDPECQEYLVRALALESGCRQVCPAMGLVRKSGGSSVRSIPRGVRSSRTARQPKTSRVGAWLAVAACLAVIVGALVYNQWRSTQFADVLVARIMETAPNVEIIRGGDTITAVLDMPLFAGDRIRTAEGRRARFIFENEQTEVELDGNTILDIGDVNEGKRLQLETGAIDAVVAPQPADRPMVITTSQARAEVKGTAFSLMVEGKATRLEVTEGLVCLTRLSDNTSVDVAAGMYAVAGEGIELAALPIGKRAIESAAGEERARPAVAEKGQPTKPREHLYGKVLFEDEFDTLDKWELVWETEDRSGVFEPAGMDPKELVTVLSEAPELVFRGRRGGLAMLNSLLERGGGIADRYVGLRSRNTIEADSFVIQARCVFGWTGGPGREFWTQVLEAGECRPISSDGQLLSVHWFRWEFQPVKGHAEPGTLRCEMFQEGETDYGMKWCYWRSSWEIRPTSRKMLLAVRNLWLRIDSVVVREMREEGRKTE